MSTTATPMTELSHYLATFEREYQNTLRVLKAFPADKATFKPSERSTPANQVAWTLVMSQHVRSEEHTSELSHVVTSRMPSSA